MTHGLKGTTMPYMLLILEKPEDRLNRPEDEGRRAYESMVRFRDGLAARGVLKESQSLLYDAKVARVTSQGGKPVVRDGPFTEAKEMVGGFFLLDCASRDEAIAIARQCPAASWATVEVRELGPCFEGAEGM
jgi:hypothetical protein